LAIAICQAFIFDAFAELQDADVIGVEDVQLFSLLESLSITNFFPQANNLSKIRITFECP